MQAIKKHRTRQALARKFQDDIRQQAHTNASVTCQEQLLRLADSLARLPDFEQSLLHMRYNKDLRIDEIAELVAKSEAAVRKRLLRALCRLRKMMDDATAG